MSTTSGVSIVVACHNASARLPETLRHLAAQRFDGSMEVLLVDNASTDGSTDVAVDAWRARGAPIPLRCIDEPELGVVNARRTGIAEARYAYVLFCDDDNWLRSDYAATASAILDARPDVGMVGGQAIARSDVPFPPWFVHRAADYAVGKQGVASSDVTRRMFLWTAGTMLRRDAYLCMLSSGAKPLVIGRKGKVLTAGEDIEMSLWFIMAGYRLWYEESLVFEHYIRPERLTDEYARRLLSEDDSLPILKSYVLMLEALRGRMSAFARALMFLRGMAKAGTRRARLSSVLAAHGMLDVTRADPAMELVRDNALRIDAHCHRGRPQTPTFPAA